MLRRVLILLLMLAACQSEPPPTPTPTREPTGPTLEPSPVVRGEVPTEPSALILGQNDPTAAALPSGGDLPPLPVGVMEPGELRQPVQVVAEDGTILYGNLYGIGTERVPGILMLAPDSTAWLDLPLRLQADGFTVLVMDVRNPGSINDFRVMLRSLSEAGTVDPGNIAVVGAEGGADLALTGCAVELLCDAVALLSPTQQQPLLLAMDNYNPRPIFLAAAEEDSLSYTAADALARYARGEVAFEVGRGTQRGAFLIQDNPELSDTLMRWLREQF